MINSAKEAREIYNANHEECSHCRSGNIHHELKRAEAWGYLTALNGAEAKAILEDLKLLVGFLRASEKIMAGVPANLQPFPILIRAEKHLLEYREAVKP